MTSKIKIYCPECSYRIDYVGYHEYGRKIYRNGQWIVDDRYGGTIYECPECGRWIELEKLRIVE